MTSIGDLAAFVTNVIAPDTTSRIMLGIFVGVMAAEGLFCLFTRSRWTNGDAWPNVISMLVGLFIDLGAGIVYVTVYMWCFTHLRLFDVPNTIIGLAYAFVVSELISYLQHRLYHRAGIFWAMHSVHHSSSEMNVTVTNRSLWGISALVPFQMVALPVLGLSLPMVGFFSAFHVIWGYFQHTQFIPKLGPLDRFINTASDHRVHHGIQQKYIDKNFSQGLILFDRIFKTYQREEETPIYGLVKPVTSRNPIIFQFAGFAELIRKIRSANTIRDRMNYLYKPPEWSHVHDEDTDNSRSDPEPSTT